MNFERSTRRSLNLPLTPLIDVVFILIIFFMLTTSFMRVESLELMLPSAGEVSNKKEVTHLFIKENGEMILGKRNVEPDELSETLVRLFSKDSSSPVMLLTADGVTMQQLVAAMDRVRASGGKSLFVRKWTDKNAQEASEDNSSEDSSSSEDDSSEEN
ncbi:MAG: biopolymer transporter ExbD [Rickettsiales bacterium]|jgi:biopolymer transport protein ExbD